MTRFAAVLFVTLLALPAGAHDEKPAHGGVTSDAGDYHVEMVAKKTALEVYLATHDNKPVDAKGHKAVGIFVIAGKPQRIELAPQSANKLSGTSPVELPSPLKGAVQITTPDGKTVQAKFQ